MVCDLRRSLCGDTGESVAQPDRRPRPPRAWQPRAPTDVVASPSASTSAAPSPSASIPGRGEDRRPDPGRRAGRAALVRRRRPVALGPRAHEPGARGPGDVRRHGKGPHELDGLRLRDDRRGCRLADGLRERRPREDRPGHRQGRCVDPGRIGTRRRGRDRRARCGWPTSTVARSTRIDPATNTVVATIPVGPVAPPGRRS